MNVIAPKAFANPTVAAPAPTAPLKKSKIELLLDCESAIRAVTSKADLSFLVVNEWRQIIAASTIFILEKSYSGKMKVTFASDVTTVDPRSPLCSNIAESIDKNLAQMVTGEWAEINNGRNDFVEPQSLVKNGIATPICYRDEPITRVILLTAPMPLSESDRVIANRMVATAAHAYWAMSGTRHKSETHYKKPVIALVTTLGVILIGCLPVPLSVLAPVEIIAKEPFVAAAPINGVIESINVDPNSVVQKGTVLFRLNDVELKGALEIAEKSVAISEARLRRAQQGAGASSELRREVGTATSELALSAAERDIALARLERSIVRSPNDGLVMLNRKEDWIGKPVSTGERILEIATANQIEASIELGLSDSIVLDNPKGITLFLDSNPLKPIVATFKSAGYQSKLMRSEQLAFPVVASIDEENRAKLRIGQRGTAQLRTDKVSLAYFLFRKPLAALRQKVGL